METVCFQEKQTRMQTRTVAASSAPLLSQNWEADSAATTPLNCKVPWQASYSFPSTMILPFPVWPLTPPHNLSLLPRYIPSGLNLFFQLL